MNANFSKKYFYSITQKHIKLNGKLIWYTLRISRFAKGMRLEVRHSSQLLVTVPKGYQEYWLKRVLKEKSNWIFKHLDRSSSLAPEKKKQLPDGSVIPFLGRELIIRLVNVDSHEKIENNEANIFVPVAEGNEAIIAPALIEWYRNQAKVTFYKKIAWYCFRLGIDHHRIYIRNQKTRWGSCSRKGNLSLNLKLMMAPEPVIDYVLIHELLHLREMNHGHRFWALVAKHCPDYKEQRKWLKDNEVKLWSII